MDFTLLIFFNQMMAHPLLDKLMVGVTLGGFALLPALGLVLLMGQDRRVGLAILVSLGVGFALTMIFLVLTISVVT